MNNRRKLVFSLGASALVAPLGSLAQRQGKTWRIGLLTSLSRQALLEAGWYEAFLQGLREHGYVDGKNLIIEWRSAEVKSERLPSLAAELVHLRPDLIVSAGTPATHALQKTSTAIPIVMLNVIDPVGAGFAKTLAHPGGNMTGYANISAELGPKQLQMLQSMVPKLSRVAVLVNPTNSGTLEFLKNVQNAGLKLAVKVLPVEVRDVTDVEKAFSDMVREKAGAFIVTRDALFIPLAGQIDALAKKYRLPSISGNLELVKAGGLMCYGPNTEHMYRRAAVYVDKILKGAKPADLPVEQPTKFELIINGKTAEALGLTIPHALLISADKVIE